MSDIIILYKLYTAVFISLISILLYKIFNKSFNNSNYVYLKTGLFISTRIVAFIIIFLIIKISPQSDVTAFYYPQAKNILQGNIPYLDFESSYSFLFPFLYSLPLIIWDTPLVFIIIAIVFELISINIWEKVLNIFFNEITAQKVIFIYLLNPISFFSVIINGQNQILIVLFLGLAILFQQKKKELWSGLFLGLGLLFTKYLFLIFVPVLVLLSAQKRKLIISFFIAGILPLILLYVFNINTLLPLIIESKKYTSGNLPFLLSALFTTILNYEFLLNMLLFLIYFGVIIYLYKNYISSHSNKAVVLNFISVVFLLFMLFSKKSYTTYLIIGFIPIISFIIYSELNLKTLIALNIFGIISVIEPSLWFRIMNNITLSSRDSNIYPGIFFILIEVILISFYFFYLRKNYLIIKNNDTLKVFH